MKCDTATSPHVAPPRKAVQHLPKFTKHCACQESDHDPNMIWPWRSSHPPISRNFSHLKVLPHAAPATKSDAPRKVTLQHHQILHAPFCFFERVTLTPSAQLTQLTSCMSSSQLAQLAQLGWVRILVDCHLPRWTVPVAPSPSNRHHPPHGRGFGGASPSGTMEPWCAGGLCAKKNKQLHLRRATCNIDARMPMWLSRKGNTWFFRLTVPQICKHVSILGFRLERLLASISGRVFEEILLRCQKLVFGFHVVIMAPVRSTDAGYPESKEGSSIYMYN